MLGFPVSAEAHTIHERGEQARMRDVLWDAHFTPALARKQGRAGRGISRIDLMSQIDLTASQSVFGPVAPPIGRCNKGDILLLSDTWTCSPIARRRILYAIERAAE